MCAGDYAAAVCAIKSTQLKQGQTTRCVFFNTRTYPSLFRKRFNFFVIRKATFRTQKRFHNKQYTPKLKDQPFESERTHFDTGFNNGSIAMHRPTIIFFFLTKSQPLNKKQPTGTINQIKQSEKTIPATTQSKTFKKQTFKTNTTNHLINQPQNQSQKQPRQSIPAFTNKNTPKTKHNKQLRKKAMFLNIKISQTATSSEPTTNTLFIKTQYNSKKQNIILPLR